MNFDLIYQELTRDEGRQLKMYSDSLGIQTIGIGHNLRDKPISERACRTIFDDDLNDSLEDLDKSLAWWRNLSEVRQRVLVNMCFNLGIHGLLEFRNMLNAALHGDFKTAAKEMLDSKWAKQVGARADRLARMMEEG
jgi:lysozyme